MKPQKTDCLSLDNLLTFVKIFVLFILALSGTVSGQQNKGRAGDFGGISNFTTYTTEQGLALSSIASSCVDRYGNLWFGTYGGGVSRFNGKSFFNFTMENGLSNNVILSILEDRQGNLWFGTNRNGVCKYDGSSITVYTTKEGLPNNTILSIAQDTEGNLWFGTYGGGIAKYDGRKFISYNISNGLAGNEIRAIYASRKGEIWIGTLGKGLSVFDGISFKNYNSRNGLPNNNISSFVEDNEGNLWIGTLGGGVCRFDGASFLNYTSKDGLANNNIWSSYRDNSGNLWFGTQGGGVTRYDGKNFSTFNTSNGLPNNFIYTIVEDKGGFVWFGTYGGGITRYEGNALTSYTTKQGLASNFIFGILQDRSGNFWFGTYNGGLSRMNKNALTDPNQKMFTNYTTKEGLAHNDIKCLYEDRNGNIWLGTTSNGLSVFNPEKGIAFKNFSTKDGLVHNKANYILQDRKGYLWFATGGGGVSRYDGKKFKTYNSDMGLVHNIIFCMLEDSKGNIWFGTQGGVSKFDGEKFTNYTVKEGLPDDRVYIMLEDREGFIWMGTDGKGISRYDGKSFVNYSEKEGLSSNTVGQIIQDSEGRIFFSTNLGLSVLTGWSDGKPVFEIYNKKTGYNIKDVIAGQKGMYLDKEGIIWITNGDDNSALLRFDYKQIKRNLRPPGISISGIRVNEEKIDWFNLLSRNGKEDSFNTAKRGMAAYGNSFTEESKKKQSERFRNISFSKITPFSNLPADLVLPYANNHITFEFEAVETSKPQLVNYQYMLDGYDADWSPVTRNSSAVFGNMREGTYTFKLRAQGANGVWSEPLLFQFSVLPPWYRTIWAYSLYFVVLVILGYAMLRLYSRRLQRINVNLERIIKERTGEIEMQSQKLSEANAAKDKFFRIIAHDLRSPISGLLKLTDLMANESENISVKEYSEISRSLNQSAGNLYKLLNNLLEWATVQQKGIEFTPARFDLMKEAVSCVNTVSEIASQKGIKIDNKINTSLFMHADEKMINTVLRNLLSNAVKFTRRGGEVVLSAQNENGSVVITISDTGIGIPADDMEKLFKIEERVGRPGTEKEPSTGLGLVLCKEFIEMHGGTIRVESVEGEGSRFIVLVPEVQI